MWKHVGLATIATLSLAACGEGRERKAAQACEDAIYNKLGNRSYEVDSAKLVASATTEGADIMHLASNVIFDKGRPTEYRQTLDCRVRFEPGKSPAVISLGFDWRPNEEKK